MKTKLKWVLLGLFIAASAASLYALGGYEAISNFLKPSQLKSFIDQFGILAPLVFMALYYGLILAFISAAAFTVISGLLFGKLWGSIYVIIAATLAAQTAFLITRKISPEKLESIKKKKGIGNLIRVVENRTKDNGFKSIFLMRCLFAPYIPLSYASGVIKTIKAQDFFLATLISNMIFTPAFVFLGDSLLEGPKALILPLIMIVLVLGIPKIIKYFKPEAPV
jgi:uncharacterized membrane protein YdjX (TVP38/TMEM64 family)